MNKDKIKIYQPKSKNSENVFTHNINLRLSESLFKDFCDTLERKGDKSSEVIRNLINSYININKP